MLSTIAAQSRTASSQSGGRLERPTSDTLEILDEVRRHCPSRRNE